MGVKNSSKQLEIWTKNISKKNHSIVMPYDFIEFNRMIGNPKHPNNGVRTDIFDYQLEYFNAVQKKHKVILNKSRKIGATETALRTIAYNCFDHIIKGRVVKGRYVEHKVMIVAGNTQSIANEFIKRFKALFMNGFTDINGNFWEEGDIVLNDAKNVVDLFNGITITAYPANESVRGEENVICVFMSEAAFVNRHDDSVVYKAVRPNLANIIDADFILESTPNGRSNFFFEIFDKANEEPPTIDFYPLLQPYQVSLGKMLFKEDIESLKKEYGYLFEQEFCCSFSTSGNQEFHEGEIKMNKDSEIDYFTDI
jgi:hypothetical protein